MPYLKFSSESGFLKLIISIMAVMAIGIIINFVGVIAAKIIFSMHLDTVNHVMFGRINELTDWQLRCNKIFNGLGFFVLPAIFLHWIFSDTESRLFVFNKRPTVLTSFYVVLSFLLIIPLMSLIANKTHNLFNLSSFGKIGEYLKVVENSYLISSNRLLSMPNKEILFFNLIIIGLLPAIGEEILFRGVIQNILKDFLRNSHISILLTAIVFSMANNQFFGFGPRLLLGIMLGYCMVWSKNIWLPILGHLVYSMFSLVIIYLTQHEMQYSWLSLLNGTGNMPLLIIITCAITALSMFLVWKKTRLVIRTFN